MFHISKFYLAISSDIETLRKLLDTVEECIAFTDRCLEHFGFLVGSVGFNDTGNFVDLAVESTVVYEVGKFTIDEVGGDAEGVGHVVDSHGLE